jgi:purine-binding chemotaxis protein CheW
MSADADDTSQALWRRVQENLRQLDPERSQKVDPAALARKLARRAAALRHRAGDTGRQTDARTFVAFRNGRHRYGILIQEVREIQALEQFAPVPHAPEFILGVTHWRGSILALLHLDHFLDLPEPGLSDLHVCLIVEAAGVRIAVVAGEVEDIISAPAAELQAAPLLPGEMASAWIVGVYRQNRIVLSMDAMLKEPRLADIRRYRASDRGLPSGTQGKGER